MKYCEFGSTHWRQILISGLSSFISNRSIQTSLNVTQKPTLNLPTSAPCVTKTWIYLVPLSYRAPTADRNTPFSCTVAPPATCLVTCLFITVNAVTVVYFDSLPHTHTSYCWYIKHELIRRSNSSWNKCLLSTFWSLLVYNNTLLGVVVYGQTHCFSLAFVDCNKQYLVPPVLLFLQVQREAFQRCLCIY